VLAASLVDSLVLHLTSFALQAFLLTLALFPWCYRQCRRWQCLVRVNGGRGGRRPVGGGVSLALASGGLVLGVLAFAEPSFTVGDRIYSPTVQWRLVVAFVVSLLLHAAWGLWMDRGRGGLETLLVLGAGHVLLWGAGLQINSLRPPGFEAPVGLSAPASLAITLVWLALVGAVVEWLDTVEGLVPAVVGAVALGIVALTLGTSPDDRLVLLMSAVLAGGCVALLPMHHPAKPLAALGKSGVLVLGHYLAVITVLARLKAPTAGLLGPVSLVLLVLLVLWVRSTARSLRFDAPVQGGR
jgi:UDP-N-acetylmuramyl pentapeptide phosphotransferase/UDP-N-acetylglucosamine-1-phosphate transferase